MKRVGLAFAAWLVLGCAPDPIEDLGPSSWPLTCDAAADDAIALLSESDREMVRSTPRDELIRFYRPGWGLAIRNRQGLWRGNTTLIESWLGAKDGHPETASMVIIERAWEKLQ